MDLGAVVRHYRMNHARNSEAELDSFRREATLSAAVARAATAETGLLDHEIFATVSSGLDAGAKDRAIGDVAPEHLDFPSAQRALPDEQLVLHPPLAQIARHPFTCLW